MAKDCITVNKGNVTAITIKDVEYKLNKPIAATTFMTNDFKQAFENKNNNRTVEAFLSINKIGYKVDSSSQVSNNVPITLKAKNKLVVRPNKGPDMIKAPIKAKYADYYLGEGVPSSSTELYSKQISKSYQTSGGDTNPGDVIFVSINGGTGYSREEAQDSTISMAKKAIKNGGILLTDNIDYINSSSYNTGEKRLHDALKAEGHTYQTIDLEGTKIGMWTNDKFKDTIDNTQETDVADAIYKKLGSRTKSGNVVIKPWVELKDATKAITSEGIISTRIKNSNEHFGNPFSSNVDGLIKTENTKESVEKYINWVLYGETESYLNPYDDFSKFAKSYKPIFKIDTDNLIDIDFKKGSAIANRGVYSKIIGLSEWRLTPDSNSYYKIDNFNELLEKEKRFRHVNTILLDGNLNLDLAKEYIDLSEYLSKAFIKIIKDNFDVQLDLKTSQLHANDKYIESQRREWIREQLKSGNLKNKPVIYYKELGEPSHATALDYLINRYDWNQNTVQDAQFSKFNTETNATQDFKDLIQSLSNKLGIPVRYDNNLPYAGAFIDGNVVLNPSKMDETTVWHEFAHPFVQAVRKQNKPLYDNLVNEIYNTPHGKTLLKEVQSLYGEKNKNIQEEEVIVELIARYATGRVDGFTAKKYKSIWDKIKEFIRNIGKMIFRNNDVVDTSAVNVFTMNLDMSIKDLSNVLKHSEIVWFSEKEEDFNNYDRKLLNLENLLYFSKKSVEDKKNEIEAYKNEPNYKIDSANKFLKTLEEEVLRVEKELSNLKEEKGKGFKINQQTVEDLKGVYHNIGAYMNNAGISTIKDSISNIVDLLKAGKKIELAAWNGRGSSLTAGDVLLSFKPQAVVKDTYVKDAFTELSESDSEGNRERFSPNTHLRDNDSSKKIDSFDYSESIMTLNKTNLRSIWILQNDSNTESWLPNLKELSDLTGAPIINKATNETIYTPENKVEYQPEIYESRFGKKDINKESPEAIYKEVEEVFIEMRLDEENSLNQDKINSFDLFLNSVFENSDDKHRTSVNNLILQDPKFENYIQNKFKFQLQQYRKELEGETDPEKIDQYNTVIQILEAKELLDVSESFEKDYLNSLDSKVNNTIDTDYIMGGLMSGATIGLASLGISLATQSPTAILIGVPIGLAIYAGGILSGIFRKPLAKFLKKDEVQKFDEKNKRIKANIYGLNNLERINDYISTIDKIIGTKENVKVNSPAYWSNKYKDIAIERVKNNLERDLQHVNYMLNFHQEDDIKFSAYLTSEQIKARQSQKQEYLDRIDKINEDAANKLEDLKDSFFEDYNKPVKVSKEEINKLVKLREILISLSLKTNLDTIPEVSMNNKYEDLMDSLLKNYGDKKLDNNLIVQDMLNKVINNKPVPGFVSRLAIRSGLMHQKNTFNKNLFKDKLMEFIDAYNVENLKSDSVKLDKLLSDYQFNQILDPVSFRNQSRLSDILLDSEYGNIPDRIKNKEHISNLTREDIMSLIELNNDLYTDAAYKMLFELNEYEHKTGKTSQAQVIDDTSDAGKLKKLEEKYDEVLYARDNDDYSEAPEQREGYNSELYEIELSIERLKEKMNPSVKNKTVEPSIETKTPTVEKIELPKVEEKKSILTRKESLTEDLINTQKEIDYMLLIQRQSDRNKLFGKMTSKDRKAEFNKHFGSLFKDSLYYRDDTNITNIIRHTLSKGKTIVQDGLLNRNATIRDLALVDQLDDYHKFIKEYDSRRMKITDLAFKRAVIRHELSNIDDALNKSNEMYNYNLINSLKAILLDYGYQYDNISQSTKEKIEKRIINDPDLLNNYEFIASLTCL